ncbi:CHAT domain [Sphingomonas paucimobilis]|nr:CHAT domain [Sphingomonas paucimobilis]
MKLDANLVVLSACDTVAGVRDEALARSAGQEEAGATLEGLVRAFLAANARAVLATYWQVSAEKESDEFIRAFYTRARTGTLGEAMQVAQQTLIALPTYSHPFYWAPYFLVGIAARPLCRPQIPAPASRPAESDQVVTGPVRNAVAALIGLVLVALWLRVGPALVGAWAGGGAWGESAFTVALFGPMLLLGWAGRRLAGIRGPSGLAWRSLGLGP